MMHHVQRAGVLGAMAAGCLLLNASTADAQTCLGAASYSAGAVQLGAGARFGNDAQAYTGRVNFGSTRAFGGIGVGGTTYDGLDGTTVSVGGAVGYQVPLGTSHRAQLCPYAGGDLGFGPNDVNGTDIDVSTRDAFLGLHLGYAAPVNPQLMVVPTGGISLVYGSTKLENGSGLSESDSDTFGTIEFGVGLIINSRVTIRPGVSIPVGLDGADATFAIDLGLSLGAKR